MNARKALCIIEAAHRVAVHVEGWIEVSSYLQTAMRRLGTRDPSALADLFLAPPEEDESP